MNFEWENNKAIANLKKHGVSFKEGTTVFGDPLAITFNDPDHSKGEYRLLTFGTTCTGKLVIVSNVETGFSNRILSVRMMTKQEKKIYEEG